MRNIYVVILFFSLVFFQSCKMQMTLTGASISPDVKTFAVQNFPNNASFVNPIISQKFTDALKNKINSQTKLQLVNNDADVNFEGFISDYRVDYTAVQGNDIAAKNRITLSMNVTFTNNKDAKQNFTSNFSNFVDYGSEKNLTDVENELLDDIINKLTDDIFNRAFVNW